MNRRDYRAEPLFATDFSECARSHGLRALEERFVAGKGASEGAAAFMNSDSGRVANTQRLNNKMVRSSILLFKSPG